jgi:tRNA(fMet)-specific endonuclease VapC
VQYLFDTDICIYIVKRKPDAVLRRFRNLRPGDVGMSIVTYLELVYAAWKSQKAQFNLGNIEELASFIPVLPLDAGVARQYARIRTELQRQRTPIGAYDLLIAAHALAEGLVLVTNNLREFARVSGLRAESWV